MQGVQNRTGKKKTAALGSLRRRGIGGGTPYQNVEQNLATENTLAQQEGQAFLNEQRYVQDAMNAEKQKQAQAEEEARAGAFREEGAANYERQRARETEAQGARQEFYRTGDENPLRYPQDWRAAWKRKLRGG